MQDIAGSPAKIEINLSSLRWLGRGGAASPRGAVEPFVREGQTAADLGCGSGYYTFALAECVGPRGRVYAVDLDEGAIQSVRHEAGERGYRNIEPHATSAADLRFIEDGSMDFVMANGLLCSMPEGQEAAVKEIHRIMKPSARAYLSLGFPPPLGHVNRAEWEEILEGFRVDRRGRGVRVKWALVSSK